MPRTGELLHAPFADPIGASDTHLRQTRLSVRSSGARALGCPGGVLATVPVMVDEVWRAKSTFLFGRPDWEPDDIDEDRLLDFFTFDPSTAATAPGSPPAARSWRTR
jgi:hypothetical protein